MANYDCYIVNKKDGVHNNPDPRNKPITDTSNGSGNNTNILGDVSADTFTFNTKTFTYLGIATAGTVTGFEATDGVHTFFFVTTGTDVPGSPTVTLTQPDNPLVPSAQWNLSTHSQNCFVAGTHIQTPAGEILVEDLRPGDLVVTASGSAAVVRWIGRQTVSRVFADPIRLLPIRIKAGALDDNIPVRDLCLSPCHAVFLDGVLVHSGALVNGTSIVRDTEVPLVFIYYHIELDAHDLVLSEGVPAESFVDNVGRMSFNNWNERPGLGLSDTAIEEMPYPRAKAHRQVPVAIRARLAARAAAFVGTCEAA